MQENENTSAWICPTDRHLALRAKLKSGWSVRSNQSTRKDVPEYTPEEMKKIQDVISKAAILEDLEQQRIGSLVQKLGLMKDNSAGDGVLTCVLCAEPFGKFMGSTPVICTDCKKKVCNKCCVDYYTGVRPSARKQSAQNSSFHWLCKICSEDRELWKRSGAWFFQALPRYKLPTPHSPLQHKRYVHSLNPAGSSPITARRGRALDSTDGKKGHARVMSGGSVQSFQWGKPARPDITSSSDEFDSSDDDGITLGKPKKTASQASDSVSYTSSTSAASFDKQTLSASSSPAVHRKLSQRRTRLQKKNPESNSTEAHDRTSVDSHVTDSSADHVAGSVDMSNLHSGSDRTPVTKRTSTEHMNYKGDRGSIEFSVTYDLSRCALHVRINRAQDLIGMDSNGLSDPYVKLHLLPGMSRSTKLRTKTRSKTLNPVFNELLTYWGVKEEELPKRKLLLTVLDEDKFGHDFIGEVAVPLLGITPNSKKSFELPLKSPYALSEAEKQAADPGRIHVGLHYNLASHSLSVNIHRCANLVPRKKDQENVNAFVKVTLSLDDRRTIVHKTEVKKKTPNPVFDRELKFQVSADNGQAELARGSLTVAVMHGHNPIGHVMFGISSSGEQLKQWFNCLKHADQQFDGWHVLSAESPKKNKGKS